MNEKVLIIKDRKKIKAANAGKNIIFEIDVEQVLDSLPEEPLFDLVVTSPPYDIGKPYEKKCPLTSMLRGKKG